MQGGEEADKAENAAARAQEDAREANEKAERLQAALSRARLEVRRMHAVCLRHCHGIE